MPRLRKTAAEVRHERNLKIADILKTSGVRAAGSSDALIRRIGISRPTWFRRLNAPEDFTLEQLQAAASLLDEEDRERIRSLILG